MRENSDVETIISSDLPEKQGMPKTFDKNRDAQSYNHAAFAYGTYINKLGRPLAERIIEIAGIVPGQKVLDVGTGTGIAARCLSRAVGPQGEVHAIDLSEGMLAVARDEVIRQGMKNVFFQQMDAENLKFEDETFDAVVSLCAVAHFPDLQASLREIKRCLKPGGKVVVSIGAGRPPFGYGFLRYACGRLIKKVRQFVEPQMWAPGALTDFVRTQAADVPGAEFTEWRGKNPYSRLLSAVEESGFEIGGGIWHGQLHSFDSGSEFWEAQSSIVTGVRQSLLHLPDERLNAIRNQFIENAEDVLRSGGKLYYPFGAFFAYGRNPS